MGNGSPMPGMLRDGSQNRAVFRRRADGSGSEELLWQDLNHSHVTDWSPDGKSILIEVADPRQRSDIFLVDVAAKTAKPADCDAVQRVERACLP